MHEMHEGLYQRISAYSLDDANSRFNFTQRLARENGWGREYASRVVEEYKKFMFLASVCGHLVTPSDQVDQAWHLHLIYTHSYWEDFCGQVLGKRIHHGPTKGGEPEQDKYRDWYDRTLASYRRFFGEEPPTDIWPDVRKRFGEDLQWMRVNVSQSWVVSKSTVSKLARRCAAVLTLMAFLSLAFVSLAGLQSTIAKPGHMAGRITSTDGDGLEKYESAIMTSQVVSASNGNDSRHNSDARTAFGSEYRISANDHQAALFEGVFVAAILLFFFVAFVIGILFGGKCASCGRAHAMEKTGNDERGEGWLATTKYEWKCKYCGETVWKADNSGGCSGCSGCGGCGGCGG